MSLIRDFGHRSASSSPRVLVVDEESVLEGSLPLFLREQGYEVTAAFYSREAWALIEQVSFDLILLDLVLPLTSGLDVLGRFKRLCPAVPVIVVTGYGDIPTAIEAIRRGARDFLPKPLDRSRLLRAMQRALARQPAEIPPVMRDLTCRERQVLSLLAEGYSDREIAEALHISMRTASNHVCNLMDKLGVKKRVRAAVLWDRYQRQQADFLTDTSQK